MKRRSFPRLFFIVSMTVFLLNCCTSSKPTNSTADSSNNTKVVSTTEGNNGLTLLNYLRRVPGIQIDERGGDVSVMIRGMSSVGSNNQPLFVVNRSPVGNSYQDAVNAVDINDIKTINVIQGTEGQQTYGMRGANGVIQIITKSADKSKDKK